MVAFAPVVSGNSDERDNCENRSESLGFVELTAGQVLCDRTLPRERHQGLGVAVGKGSISVSKGVLLASGPSARL